MGGIFLENSIKPIEIDDDYADILKIKENNMHTDLDIQDLKRI